MLTEIEVSPEGNAFISQCLSEGHTLAHLVAQHQLVEAGRVVALLPPDVSKDQATDFEGWPTGVEDAWPYLAEQIIAYTQQGPGHLIVVESSYAEAADERQYRPVGQTVLFYEEEVLHVIDASYTDADRINSMLTVASGYPTNGVFVALPPSVTVPTWYTTVDSLFLAVLAEHAEAIIVTAYDRLSWLIWRKV